MKKRTCLTLAVATLAAVGLAAPAQAASPNCWGVVSSQSATGDGRSFGEHAASQSTPRLGLGNVARAFGLDGVAELGSVLASIDGDPNTFCS